MTLCVGLRSGDIVCSPSPPLGKPANVILGKPVKAGKVIFMKIRKGRQRLQKTLEGRNIVSLPSFAWSDAS